MTNEENPTKITSKSAIYQTQAFKSVELTQEQAEFVDDIFSREDIGVYQKYMVMEDFFLRNMAQKLDALCSELKEQSYMKEYISGVRHARLALLNHLSHVNLVRVHGEE